MLYMNLNALHLNICVAVKTANSSRFEQSVSSKTCENDHSDCNLHYVYNFSS